MENQHRKIEGYRELDTDEIDAMNQLKSQEQDVLRLLTSLDNGSANDVRWLKIARTHIEQGFMAAVRAVARPNT